MALRVRAPYVGRRKGTRGQAPVFRRSPVNQSRKRWRTMEPNPDQDALLTPSEVAAMFRVNPKTVTRWARAGKISAIRTLGGHRRFRAAEIKKFLEQVEEGAETP